MARARKALRNPEAFGHSAPLRFGDAAWGRITATLGEPLPPDDAAKLRLDIERCCGNFLAQKKLLERGINSARAVTPPKPGDLAPFDRLIHHLEMAAAAWEEIGDFHDNALGDASQYDLLKGMTEGAKRQLVGLQKLGKPSVLEDADDPFGILVLSVANAWRCIELRPTASNSTYQGGNPTEFQRFMAEIDRNLLGSKNLIGLDDAAKEHRVVQYRGESFEIELPKQYDCDPNAFYAEIARWLRKERQGMRTPATPV
jgi:hypothetical protein